MLKTKLVKNVIIDYYRHVGLITDEMNIETIFEARGKKLYDLDIEDLQVLMAHLENNDNQEDLGDEIMPQLQRQLLNLHVRRDKIDDEMTEMEYNVIRRELLIRDEIRQEYQHYNNVNLPQWLLLKRARVLSVQNNLRKNQMFRLGTVIKKARPVFEFNEVIDYATNRFYDESLNRVSASYPYFRSYLPNEKRHRRKILDRSVPYIWFKELKKLPSNLKRMIKDDNFVNATKRFYHKRCQHSENDTKLCEACQSPKNGYRLTDNQILMRNIQEFETNVNPIRVEIDNSLRESEILEIRYANEENLIYELTNRNFFHLKRTIERHLNEQRRSQ